MIDSTPLGVLWRAWEGRCLMDAALGDPSAAALRVYLFGRFRVLRDAPVKGLEAVRAQELLSYLMLNNRRAHSRHGLAEQLWSDVPSAQAHKHLRQALWHVLSALHRDNEPTAERLVTIESDAIGINPRASVWIDVCAFEDALRAAPTSVEGYALRRAAVELYQGELLEGWYQDWCLFERERLQGIYLSALDTLIDNCETSHDWDAGLEYGFRVLRSDPARERTHRRLMRLHYLAGDRAAALRQYQRCAEALDSELGVPPSRPTLRLLEQISVEHLDADPASVAEPPPPHQLLTNLEDIRAALANLQLRVEREIARLAVVIN